MFPRTHLLKKKLNKNQHRSIILAQGGQYWIDEYLFGEKKDRDNLGGQMACFHRRINLITFSLAEMFVAHQVTLTWRSGNLRC